MKFGFLFLILTLCFCLRAISAEIKDEKVFLDSVRLALNGKSIKDFDSLTYQVGMSEADKKESDEVISQLLINLGAIQAISMKALPEDFEGVIYANGKKIEVTSPPKGIIDVVIKQKDQGVGGVQFPYAIINGAYYITLSKTTDLGWRGPPDVFIGYSIVGKGQEKVMVQCKYNVSGIDISKAFASTNEGFRGQYISELTVTSNDADGDLTMTINQNGKEIYTKSLEGKGTMRYHRSQTSKNKPKPQGES